jgi:hypothetical protein
MKLIKQHSGIILATGLALCILTAGCVGDGSFFRKTSNPPEPETGITSWISAMNSKDIPRLYALSPLIIRSNISEQDFIQANTGNLLLQPGIIFSDPEILNKTSDGKKATIKAMITMDRPGEERIPLFYTFQLFFDYVEWKVWTNDI